MTIFVKMQRCWNSKNSSFGKYYVKTVPMGEVSSRDLALRLEDRAVFRSGLVQDVLNEVAKEMKWQLQQGKTVSLDGIGRFQLVAVSDGVDTPDDFDLTHGIKQVECRFLPEGHRDKINGTIRRTLSEGTKVQWALPNETKSEE